MKDRKTLIILTPGFPADERDENCLPFPQRFVKNFQAFNPSIEVIVIAFQYPFNGIPYTWNGIQVIPFNGRHMGKIHRLLLWKRVWQKIKNVASEKEMLGILSFWLGECALVGKHAAAKNGIPHFTWLQGQDARQHNRYAWLIKPKPGSLIALSDFLSGEYFKNYRLRPAYTIPPGLDTNAFEQATVPRTIDILGAGSLIPLKRFDLFIKMISSLVKKNPGLKAVICGDGPERGRLERLIEEGNIGANITLTGELAHRDLLSLMQSSKIFLHPSSYEGFSTACTEALYAGAQVISFCKPMHREFEHFLNPAGEEEMLSMLERLLGDKNLDHQPVLTYPIRKTCSQVLALFLKKENTEG